MYGAFIINKAIPESSSYVYESCVMAYKNSKWWFLGGTSFSCLVIVVYVKL